VSEASTLVCSGCGTELSADEPLPFRCPRAGEPGDHVVVRRGPPPGARFADAACDNPFLRFRELAYPWHVAKARGMADAEYVDLVAELDARVEAVAGTGFRVTPAARCGALARALGVASVAIKDETGNVAGSHKARHLFGIALYLAVAERTGLAGPGVSTARLAIASCGNAALAAAVVARAAGRALDVFVPTWAEAAVVERLRDLGATLIVCPRRDGDPPGDPCVHRFRDAVAGGALPFSCQGPDNGLTIDGGMTLGFELAEQFPDGVDRLFIQVGGGALASATAQALRWARDLGRLQSLPRLHAVQSAGAAPLVRAWRRSASLLAERCGGGPQPGSPAADAALARRLAAHLPARDLAAGLRELAARRSELMWPWEQEPRSIATGILDDETYDWLAVVQAMVATGGWPVVAAEATLARARDAGEAEAGIAVSATGAAGLAGAFERAGQGGLDAADRVALLFTGVRR
jgi:threonine synthase